MQYKFFLLLDVFIKILSKKINSDQKGSKIIKDFYLYLISHQLVATFDRYYLYLSFCHSMADN